MVLLVVELLVVVLLVGCCRLCQFWFCFGSSVFICCATNAIYTHTVLLVVLLLVVVLLVVELLVVVLIMTGCIIDVRKVVLHSAGQTQRNVYKKISFLN